MPTIVSLFDRTGNWSQPYKDAGYDVLRFDLQTNGWNVFYLHEDACKNLLPVHGLLMAPPCDDMAVSGSRWFEDKDRDGRTTNSIRIFRHCLKIVDWLKPVWWVMENPVGRVNSLMPEFKPFGPRYFQPWWYGDPYTKTTGLWGNFIMPPRDINIEVSPETFGKIGKPGSSHLWAKMGGKSQKTKNARSETPKGFAQAFFKSNP